MKIFDSAQKSKISDTVKGFRDYTGQEAMKRARIRTIVEETFNNYGFEPAETPVIEYEEFVKSGNENDESVSDTFKLQDRGKRKLALRYELTFPLKRVMQNKKLPYRRYQIGPVFRDEPTTGNRFRQFISCDADIIGSTEKDEAEIIKLASEILEKLNVKYKIYFNNRRLLNEILDEQGIKDKERVIKEIDKLDKLPEKEVKENLKKYKAEKLLTIFKEKESYFKKYKAYSEIEGLKEYCKIFNVEVNFQPSLARGLSYYSGTVFEIKSSIKETILGGGSYVFNGIQCCGFGVGIERLGAVSDIKIANNKILIVSIEQDKKAIQLAEKIRKSGTPCLIMYGKPGKALDYANSYKIPYAIFLGKNEAEQGKFKLRDMKTGKEKLISEKELVEDET